MIRPAGTDTFELGRLLATPGALAALKEADQHALEFIGRHLQRDWGIVDGEDWRANDEALRTGARILSAYRLQTGAKIWIITEADRSTSTILLPEEY